MNAWRGLLALVAAGGLAVTLTGCFSAFYLGESSPELTADDVVGTWTSTGPAGQVATIEFRDDGSATATAVPTNLASGIGWEDDEVDWSRTFDAVGTWTLDHMNGVSGVHIRFPECVGRCDYLHVFAMADDDGTHLVAHVSDADLKIRALFDPQS